MPPAVHAASPAHPTRMGSPSAAAAAGGSALPTIRDGSLNAASPMRKPFAAPSSYANHGGGQRGSSKAGGEHQQPSKNDAGGARDRHSGLGGTAGMGAVGGMGVVGGGGGGGDAATKSQSRSPNPLGVAKDRSSRGSTASPSAAAAAPSDASGYAGPAAPQARPVTAGASSGADAFATAFKSPMIHSQSTSFTPTSIGGDRPPIPFSHSSSVSGSYRASWSFPTGEQQQHHQTAAAAAVAAQQAVPPHAGVPGGWNQPGSLPQNPNGSPPHQSSSSSSSGQSEAAAVAGQFHQSPYGQVPGNNSGQPGSAGSSGEFSPGQGALVVYKHPEQQQREQQQEQQQLVAAMHAMILQLQGEVRMLRSTVQQLQQRKGEGDVGEGKGSSVAHHTGQQLRDTLQEGLADLKEMIQHKDAQQRARLFNSTSIRDKDPLDRLPNDVGELPKKFPQCRRDVILMPMEIVTYLLEFYGLPKEPKETRLDRLAKFIGVRLG